MLKLNTGWGSNKKFLIKRNSKIKLGDVPSSPTSSMLWDLEGGSS
jgi:hypothetical protein